MREWGAIRVARFEIWRVAGDHKEVYARWRQLAIWSMEAHNLIWRHWLVWHTQNDSPAKIRSYLDALDAWNKAQAGDDNGPLKPRIMHVIRMQLNRYFKSLTSSGPKHDIGEKLVRSMANKIAKIVASAARMPKDRLEQFYREVTSTSDTDPRYLDHAIYDYVVSKHLKPYFTSVLASFESNGKKTKKKKLPKLNPAFFIDAIAEIIAHNPKLLYEVKKEEFKPTLDVQAVPTELQNSLYYAVRDRFPKMYARVWVLILQAVLSGIKTRKAANGSLSGWMAILLDREAVPQCTRPIPIRVDCANAQLMMPQEVGGNLRFQMRISRLPTDGKPGVGVVDEVELKSTGRAARKHSGGKVAIAYRILGGHYKFCGSSILWDRMKNKWYVLISYRIPKMQPDYKPVPGKTLIIRPGYKRPWLARVNGRSFSIGGTGKHVEMMRQRVRGQRLGRQAMYRYAGSANKGHGRNRAIQAFQVLSRSWKDFVKSANHFITAQVVKIALAEECERVVYFQPDGAFKESRFLNTAGKIDDRDSSGWDWYQVQTFLSYKCEDAGLDLLTRKVGDRELAGV